MRIPSYFAAAAKQVGPTNYTKATTGTWHLSVAAARQETRQQSTCGIIQMGQSSETTSGRSIILRDKIRSVILPDKWRQNFIKGQDPLGNILVGRPAKSS